MELHSPCLSTQTILALFATCPYPVVAACLKKHIRATFVSTPYSRFSCIYPTSLRILLVLSKCLSDVNPRPPCNGTESLKILEAISTIVSPRPSPRPQCCRPYRIRSEAWPSTQSSPISETVIQRCLFTTHLTPTTQS